MQEELGALLAAMPDEAPVRLGRARVLARPSRRPGRRRRAVAHRQGRRGDDGDAAGARVRRRARDLHRHRRRPARVGAGRRRRRRQRPAAARHGRVAALPASRGAALRHRPLRHRPGLSAALAAAARSVLDGATAAAHGASTTPPVSTAPPCAHSPSPRPRSTPAWSSAATASSPAPPNAPRCASAFRMRSRSRWKARRWRRSATTSAFRSPSCGRSRTAPTTRRTSTSAASSRRSRAATASRSCAASCATGGAGARVVTRPGRSPVAQRRAALLALAAARRCAGGPRAMGGDGRTGDGPGDPRLQRDRRRRRGLAPRSADRLPVPARRRPGAQEGSRRRALLLRARVRPHRAQHRDEAAADCWAARELAQARNGSRYLAAAIAHFRHRPADYSPRYGTPNQRAERIQSVRRGSGTLSGDVVATPPARFILASQTSSPVHRRQRDWPRPVTSGAARHEPSDRPRRPPLARHRRPLGEQERGPAGALRDAAHRPAGRAAPGARHHRRPQAARVLPRARLRRRRSTSPAAR